MFSDLPPPRQIPVRSRLTPGPEQTQTPRVQTLPKMPSQALTPQRAMARPRRRMLESRPLIVEVADHVRQTQSGHHRQMGGGLPTVMLHPIPSPLPKWTNHQAPDLFQSTPFYQDSSLCRRTSSIPLRRGRHELPRRGSERRRCGLNCVHPGAQVASVVSSPASDQTGTPMSGGWHKPCFGT